ncbi:hypothetical protein BST81_16500 [Leptolyngbya sp. 'hensonii']|uniref:hypothetical protein n=1 Tax=Leptolyngbya sp. 'hensonii' TaxID=1922337 RepID=UPI0009501C53|nr:hypothetical protein [Leptolyngbya sp. 'hensonii']OLP17395.1 hypothetical protein BST81_16500 [Leptolyngbya sp. 'hensonii']
MKSYSAYFVRLSSMEEARSRFSTVEPIADSPWLMCDFRKDAPPPDDEVLEGQKNLTQEKSRRLGEILFVYGDTSVDGFVYEHACDGTLLRKLVWFPLLDDDWTAGWLCADGEPEPWETALFREDSLARFLENERQRLEDEGMEDAFPEREAEIREIWSAKQIMAGKTFPSCDGTVALLVEQSYGIQRSR